MTKEEEYIIILVPLIQVTLHILIDFFRLIIGSELSSGKIVASLVTVAIMYSLVFGNSKVHTRTLPAF